MLKDDRKEGEQKEDRIGDDEVAGGWWRNREEHEHKGKSNYVTKFINNQLHFLLLHLPIYRVGKIERGE